MLQVLCFAGSVFKTQWSRFLLKMNLTVSLSRIKVTGLGQQAQNG